MPMELSVNWLVKWLVKIIAVERLITLFICRCIVLRQIIPQDDDYNYIAY